MTPKVPNPLQTSTRKSHITTAPSNETRPLNIPITKAHSNRRTQYEYREYADVP